jgi:hypothetical protein
MLQDTNITNSANTSCLMLDILNQFNINPVKDFSQVYFLNLAKFLYYI